MISATNISLPRKQYKLPDLSPRSRVQEASKAGHSPGLFYCVLPSLSLSQL